MLHRVALLKTYSSTYITPKPSIFRDISSLTQLPPSLQQISVIKSNHQPTQLTTTNIFSKFENSQISISKSMSNTTKMVSKEKIRTNIKIEKISDTYEKKLENIESILATDVCFVFNFKLIIN